MTATPAAAVFAELLGGQLSNAVSTSEQRRDDDGRFAARIPAPNHSQGSSGVYRPLPADGKTRFEQALYDSIAGRSPNGDTYKHSIPI